MRRILLILVSVLVAVGMVSTACSSSDDSEESAGGPSSSATATSVAGRPSSGGPGGAGGSGAAGPAAGPGGSTPSTMPKRTTTTTVARPKPGARPGAAGVPRTTTTRAPKPAPTTTTTAPRPAPTVPPKPEAFCEHLGRLSSLDPTSLPGFTLPAVDTVLNELTALRAGAPPVAQPWLDALIAPTQLLRAEIEAGRVTDGRSVRIWVRRVALEQPQLAKDLRAAQYNLAAYYEKRCQG